MNRPKSPINRARDGRVSTNRPRPLLVVCIATLAVVAMSCTPAHTPMGRRPAPTGAAERNIVFPVAREMAFRDTFGDPRGGGTRSHAGQDLMAPKMTPLIATTDGHVEWLRWSNAGNAGNMLVLSDKDGWEYWYMHINNDTPGTDDGVNRYDRAFADGIRAGQRVKAGEVIAWVGDSGNAENSGSHVHFEIHRPDGQVINPFNTLAHAELRQRSNAQTAADRPVGNLEALTSTSGKISVWGWGLDAHSDDPVITSVYINGNPVASSLADHSRPDVAAAYPGRGSRHGFEFSDVVAATGAEVCVVLHSTDGGGNTRLPCRNAPR